MLRDLQLSSDPTDDTFFMTVVDEEHAAFNVAPDHVDPLDDVFGSAPPSPIQTSAPSTDSARAAASQHPSDIPRIRSTHVTNGYREGVAASKEKFLQDGFDEGYALGAELGLKAGWLLGALEGLIKALPDRGAGESGNQSEEVHHAQDRELVRRMLEDAGAEMKIERLCSREWFGEDGIWLFQVSEGAEASDGEENVSFAEVADAHPVLAKWRKEVHEVAHSMGVHLP